MGVESGGRRERAIDRADAATWLRRLLKDVAMPATVVQTLATQEGFSTATVRRAKAKAGVGWEREGYGKDSQIVWFLRSPMGAQPAQPEHLCASDGNNSQITQQDTHRCSPDGEGTISAEPEPKDVPLEGEL